LGKPTLKSLRVGHEIKAIGHSKHKSGILSRINDGIIKELQALF
jgi:hypothetical protein